MNHSHFIFRVFSLILLGSSSGLACEIKWANPSTPSINRIFSSYSLNGREVACNVVSSYPSEDVYKLSCADGAAITIGMSDMCGPGERFPSCDYSTFKAPGGATMKISSTPFPVEKTCTQSEVIENKKYGFSNGINLKVQTYYVRAD